MGILIDSDILRKIDCILNDSNSQLTSLSGKELQDLACCWCYYSGKIEGNTYTLVETESLLLDNITSEKRYDDAKMLKNLYNTFISELEYIHKEHNQETIDERTLLRVHTMISNELVDFSESGRYRNRPVRITGTAYIPPKSQTEIITSVNDVFCQADLIDNPIEKAVFVHCNIARIQPFIDGNKRVSRMLEAVVYMNSGLVPPFSTADKDILDYRKAIVHFYESNDYKPYFEFVINKQLERLDLFKESPEPKFNETIQRTEIHKNHKYLKS